MATCIFLIFVFNTIQAQAQPANTSQTSAEIHLIGQVDVHNLHEASGTAPETDNVQPVHHKDSQKFAQEKAEAESHGFVPPGGNAKVITTVPTAPLTVSSNLILEGAPGVSPNPCSCSPPDPNLGVGPNHVFEMVNLAGIIYYKNGTLAKGTFTLSNFFGLPPSSMSDPEILFDAGSGRWFASIADIPDGRVQFAVSTSNDPTGTWNLYSTPSSSTLPDQPFIGASDDKFVISANDFGAPPTYPYIGVQYWIINKTELVAGSSTVHAATNTPDPANFSVHPAQHLGSSSGQFYMVTVNDTTSTATLFTVGGIPPNPVTVTPNSFAIKSISVPPSAVQPGTSITLDTNDYRVLSAVWENNSLWFSTNDACTPSGDTTTRSCARLIQITTSGTPTKVQDFDYGASGQYFFYPAVSLYQGQLVVVYGLSSSTIYPSLLVTGRVPTDPVSTLQTPSTIRSGTASDTSTIVNPVRYGDYFGAATDPIPSASSTFWVAGEYRKSSGFQSWNTAIAQVAAFGIPASLGAPSITSFAPASPVSDFAAASRTFSINVNQTVTVTWYINGTLKQTNPSISSASYTNTSAALGIWNVSAVANNTNGNAMHTWLWNVTVAPPSLSVSANPSTITRTQTSTITASTLPVQSGIIISFATSRGSLTPTSCTSNSTGKCSVNFRSSSTGTARITASNSSYISGNTTVTVRR